MSWEDLLGIAVTAGLFAYLLWSMVRAEKVSP